MKKPGFIITTLVVAVISFLLTRIIWPDPAGAIPPPPQLLVWFIILGVAESLTFGFGVSLLLFFWNKGKTHLWPFLALVWLLISWWPHDNLHRVTPESNLLGLLLIEYAFHISLMIGGFILARYIIANITHPAKAKE